VRDAASNYLIPLWIGHARAFETFALGDRDAAATAVAWGIANKSTFIAALEYFGLRKGMPIVQA
jgi:enoyl-CoA hydratase/carnithine racemase